MHEQPTKVEWFVVITLVIVTTLCVLAVVGPKLHVLFH